MLTSVASKWNVEALTLLRVVTGIVFWEHGAQKLFGLLGGRAVEFPALLWFAGILEFYGGIAIALGLFTRSVAFVLAGEMAFAYFLSHFPRGLWPIENQGERAVLFCFIYLYLVTVGGGKFQMSNLFTRKGRE